MVKLINITLLTMLQANHAATGVWSIIILGLFGLVLYMAVIKAALVMVFMAPQAFPDQVLQVISVGMGDLGQSQALSTALNTFSGVRAVGPRGLGWSCCPEQGGDGAGGGPSEEVAQGQSEGRQRGERTARFV